MPKSAKRDGCYAWGVGGGGGASFPREFLHRPYEESRTVNDVGYLKYSQPAFSNQHSGRESF